MSQKLSISMLIEFFILSIFISIFMPLTIGYFVLIEDAPIYYANGTSTTFGVIAPSIVITLFKQVLPILFPIIVIVAFVGYLYVSKD